MRLDKRAFRSALGQDLPEARAKLAVNIRSRLDQGQKAGGPPRPVCPNAGSEETSLRERCKIERMVADGHEQARIASVRRAYAVRQAGEREPARLRSVNPCGRRRNTHAFPLAPRPPTAAPSGSAPLTRLRSWTPQPPCR